MNYTQFVEDKKKSNLGLLLTYFISVVGLGV